MSTTDIFDRLRQASCSHPLMHIIARSIESDGRQMAQHSSRLAMMRRSTFGPPPGMKTSVSNIDNIPLITDISLLNIQHNKRDVEPACSFTDHTLPVTDVQIGLGTMPHLRLVTSSIDRSCKVCKLPLRSTHGISHDFAALGCINLESSDYHQFPSASSSCDTRST